VITLTSWGLFLLLGFGALLYGSGPILLTVIVLLAVPSLRCKRRLRIFAYGLLALEGLLSLFTLPVLMGKWKEHEATRRFDAATYHLTSPQGYGGISFPAGSTVHVGEDGKVEFGSLPTPTLVGDLLLVGDFQIGAESIDPSPGISKGTLAGTAEIHGIPCGPGALISQPETTRCVLASDYVFLGHTLARGTLLEIYRSPLNDPPRLNFGTLGRSEVLFDVLWQTGTMMGGVEKPPEQMRHGNGPESLLVEFCVPSGLAVTIEGATLHGLLSYAVQEGRRMVSPVCTLGPEAQVGSDGYAQVGNDRYTSGERPTAEAAWKWKDPYQDTDH
jgi:hypothetical protein